jgi:hypothetical protein
MRTVVGTGVSAATAQVSPHPEPFFKEKTWNKQDSTQIREQELAEQLSAAEHY